MENIIVIKGLHKSFSGSKVLKGLDLNIRRAEHFTYRYENGVNIISLDL